MKKKTKVVLIDSHALIHRAFHALPPMSTEKGVPTNAVYGFTTMLLKIFDKLKPTHVVAAFDVKGSTFRHDKFKEYKASRKPAPDELKVQFDIVRRVLEAFNVPVISKSGFEADDIIGTLVKEMGEEVKKVIVTGDMDALQLIDKNTFVFTLRRGISDTVLYDRGMVLEKYGFGPEHVVDYKGLRGDPSDNIPGVSGVGDKTAKDLISQYGSIENIFKHINDLSNRARGRLEGNEGQAIFSRDLATIKRDVPIAFKLSDAELDDFDIKLVKKIFEELGFRNMLSRIPKAIKKEVQPSLFVCGKKEEMPKNYHLVETKQEQEQLRSRLSKEAVIAFDTETDGLGANEYPIIGMSFSVKNEAWYVPVSPSDLTDWQELLEDKSVGKVGHNLKYDFEVLAQSGISLSPIVFDSMLASYLLHPDLRQHSLDVLSEQEFDYTAISITSLIGQKGKQKKMSEVSLKELARYACEDADMAWRLYQRLSKKIEKEDLLKVLDDLELPLIEVLAHIELAGIKVSVKQLKEIDKKVAKRLKVLESEIYKMAGEEFNINSTQQLRSILYDKLGISTDGIARTKTGFSTAAAELDKLRSRHLIIKVLEEYRELNKLLNTYIRTLPKMVNTKTSRIYASFNQTVAATGRLSSTNPNLQNIPARTKQGQQIRAAFIADKGMTLVKADYSQIELRLVAHMSQDEKMIKAFIAGDDIHTATAAWVNNIDIKEVTDKQRRNAKTLNFGVLYGMGPQKFAHEAEVELREAKDFIEAYKKQYQGITRFIKETILQAKEVGYVQTLFGRKRYLPEISASSPGVRAQAERSAFNFPIQGTAADVLKKAMISLYQHMEKEYPEAKIVLTVHDELVCEVLSGQSEKLAKDMKRIMEDVIELRVPLIADVFIGDNWRDTKKVIFSNNH